MDSHTRQQVVVSDAVAVLEEDAVVGNLLFRRWHLRFLLNLLLQSLDGVSESDVDCQSLTVQLPFGLIRDIRDLNLDRDRALNG